MHDFLPVDQGTLVCDVVSKFSLIGWYPFAAERNGDWIAAWVYTVLNIPSLAETHEWNLVNKQSSKK